LYYDTVSGAAYRWITEDNYQTYEWTAITDESIAAALQAANNAQSTADGKMKVFSKPSDGEDNWLPSPPY
jgi:hypothetical protein